MTLNNGIDKPSWSHIHLSHNVFIKQICRNESGCSQFEYFITWSMWSVKFFFQPVYFMFQIMSSCVVVKPQKKCSVGFSQQVTVLNQQRTPSLMTESLLPWSKPLSALVDALSFHMKIHSTFSLCSTNIMVWIIMTLFVLDNGFMWTRPCW